ncbi:MAG TPA: DPP IV N-terminal domain-containing protein [Gemmatimonadales bacterium]|jgi:Tol biopolymer transport system component
MNRFAIGACAIALLGLDAGCRQPFDATRDGAAEIRVSASVAGTPINVLVITVSAPDIPTPLVFNLTAQNGVAQGTVRLPPGAQRLIKAEAFDADGNLVADGSKTLDVRPGVNPPVSIPMISKSGDIVVTVTLGPVSIVIQPTVLTIQVGTTLQLAATITAANGDLVSADPEWATTNPAVATVDRQGRVTGVTPGIVHLVASYAGVAATSNVTVETQIAFMSDRAGIGLSHIYIMGSDGANVRQVTNGDWEAYPAWSADGMRLAFSGWDGTGVNVFFTSQSGGTPVEVTHRSLFDFFPAWSPDGTRIAFTEFTYPHDTSTVELVNPDGTGFLQRSSYPHDQQPAWSPDGTKIAFVSRRDSLTYHIWVMNADGTGETQLTSGSWDDHGPAWSPDGTKIAFHSTRSGTFQIYVMNADGSGVVRLTTSSAADEVEPTWSPDGSMLAFSSNRSGNFEIYTMRDDGTNVVRITNDSAADRYPRWQPK